MENYVVYGAFQNSILTQIKTALPKATLGYGVGYSATSSQSAFDSVVRDIKALRTGENIVFASCGITYMTDTFYNQLDSEYIPIGLWTLDTEEQIINMHKSVFFVLSDSLNATEVLYNHAIHLYDDMLEL